MSYRVRAAMVCRRHLGVALKEALLWGHRMTRFPKFGMLRVSLISVES